MSYKDTVLTLNDKVMLEPLSLNDFSDLPTEDPTIHVKVLAPLPFGVGVVPVSVADPKNILPITTTTTTIIMLSPSLERGE